MVLHFVNRSDSAEDFLVELNPQMDWSGFDKYEISDRMEELWEQDEDEWETFEEIMCLTLDEYCGEGNWWYAESETIIL